jgi:hypothetical protein
LQLSVPIPVAANHLDAMLGMDRAYLAHEYLDDDWRLLQFSDVVGRLGQADLAYAGSATLTENFDAFAVPADLLPLLAQTTDPVLRETLRDFAANKFFRRDIFCRGGTPVDAAERRKIPGRCASRWPCRGDGWRSSSRGP